MLDELWYIMAELTSPHELWFSGPLDCPICSTAEADIEDGLWMKGGGKNWGKDEPERIPNFWWELGARAASEETSLLKGLKPTEPQVPYMGAMKPAFGGHGPKTGL